MPHDLERPLVVLSLLALRIVPSVWWLAWTARSTALALSLGIGASLSLLPFALRIAPPSLESRDDLWTIALWELARGATIGFGGILPVLALGWAGRINDTLRDGATSPAGAWTFPLERLYGTAAVAIFFATGAHVFVFRALASSLLDVPFGSGSSAMPALQAVALELGKLLARAFEIGIVVSAPVMFVVTTAAVSISLATRLSTPIGAALLRGPLLPVVGLSAACLSISGILEEYPQLAQVFADATFVLLRGLR